VVEVSLPSVGNIIAATTTEKYTELAKAFFSLGPCYALDSILLEIPSLKRVGLIGKTSLNAKLFT